MANKDLIIKPKRAKGDDGYRTFSIRIKEEIVSKLDNISTQTGHSRNDLLVYFWSMQLRIVGLRKNKYIFLYQYY